MPGQASLCCKVDSIKLSIHSRVLLWAYIGPGAGQAIFEAGRTATIIPCW